MPSDHALLALVTHGEVGEEAHLGQLSSREEVHLAGLANPRVRRRWLAGRLAAKSLLLKAFPAASCREIEVLPAAAGGPPRLAWRGRELPVRVSISHGGGFSCAALADQDTATGVDLETVAPRVAAFYRGNFTPRERDWAEAAARSTGLTSEWLYTFLWTVKEAALKSGATPVRSVWAMAGLEVRLPADLPARLEAGRRPALGERFTPFETLVCAARRCTRARIETTATPGVVLSLFTAVEASHEDSPGS